MGRKLPEGFVRQKISLKEGLIVISLLLFTVFLFDYLSKETITSATSSSGITGASHVEINNQRGIEKFKIQMHNFLEVYDDSGKNLPDKRQLITDTEAALEELYLANKQ